MWFLIGVTLILITWFIASQGLVNPIKWIAKNGGAWTGIKIVMAIVLVASLISMLSGCTVSMTAGLDYHYDGRSPQCEPYASDDRSTSNIGFRAKREIREGLTASCSYLHHSCAFGPDAKEYNAVGCQLEQDLWAM